MNFAASFCATRRTKVPLHAAQCFGFALCGVALAAAVLPAASQTTMAVLSQALLGRRLSRLQLAAVRPAAHNQAPPRDQSADLLSPGNTCTFCQASLHIAGAYMQPQATHVSFDMCSCALLEQPQLLVWQHMARSHSFTGLQAFARSHDCRNMTAQAKRLGLAGHHCQRRPAGQGCCAAAACGASQRLGWSAPDGPDPLAAGGLLRAGCLRRGCACTLQGSPESPNMLFRQDLIL